MVSTALTSPGRIGAGFRRITRDGAAVSGPVGEPVSSALVGPDGCNEPLRGFMAGSRHDRIGRAYLADLWRIGH
jgi:hypothetical protein